MWKTNKSTDKTKTPAACCGDAQQAAPLGKGNNNNNNKTCFAWNMHCDVLDQTKASKNFVVSPYSLVTAFGMAMLGARGETYDELLKSLSLSSRFESEKQLLDAFKSNHDNIEHHSKNNENRNADDKASFGYGGGYGKQQPFELHTAARLYVQKDFGVNAEYLKKLSHAFATQLEQVDFKASPETVRQQINKFVEEVTRNKIKDLLPSGVLDHLVRMVIISAIYMKAEWQEQFNKSKTNMQGEFYVAHEKRMQSNIPMMSLREILQYAENDVAQFVWLPYRYNAATMIVAVPCARDGGLQALRDSIDKNGNGDGLTGLLKSLKVEHGVEVELTMPRFRVETSLDLNGMMQRLGVKLAFDERRADFGGMVDDADDPETKLFISKAMQKVFIDVDENGTEAAAATAVCMAMCCSSMVPNRTITLRVDRPFMFYIQHGASGLTLFSGAVAHLDPVYQMAHQNDRMAYGMLHYNSPNGTSWPRFF